MKINKEAKSLNMEAARIAGVLVCLLGLALTSATGHSEADSVRQVLEELSR